jgi:hypothetical protein
MKKAKPKAEGYSVILTIGAEVFSAAGATLLDALNEIKPRGVVKAIGKLEVTNGARALKMPLHLNKTKIERLFYKPLELALFAKRITGML